MKVFFRIKYLLPQEVENHDAECSASNANENQEETDLISEGPIEATDHLFEVFSNNDKKTEDQSPELLTHESMLNRK